VTTPTPGAPPPAPADPAPADPAPADPVATGAATTGPAPTGALAAAAAGGQAREGAVPVHAVPRPAWTWHAPAGRADDEVVLHDVPGGVCAVPGFRAAGIRAGLKRSGKPDLALVAADALVTAAAVQTTNQVQAAPVRVTADHVADGRARAVVLNSGNANACTGADGLAVARATAAAVAEALGCAATDVLVCSTGVIGVPLAATPLLPAIPDLVAALSPDGSADAARAIMTTDTVPKEAAVRAADAEGACVVGGIAKGAGMLAPALATMLCVLTTDAPLDAPGLHAALARATARTFGRVSVDSCRSTNDAVILLSTGRAPSPPSPATFERALNEVCGELAEALVRDGEGATKLLRVRVTSAASEDDALAVARTIAGSELVRTAVAGGDPNWGRIVAATGAAPVPVDPDTIDVAFGGVTVCRDGVAAPFDADAARAHLAGDDVDLHVDLRMGLEQATVLTTDLTHGYITINADYTT